MKLNHNKKSVKISLNLFALYAVMVCRSEEHTSELQSP